MRFSQIAKGTRQDEPIELPRFNGQPDDSPPLKCLVRALNGIEEERALSSAFVHAKAQGVEKPEPGDTLFDFALMVETIAIACLDPESPEKERAPFFDGGPDQVREWYGREAIALIHELQQDYQDRVAPTISKLGPLEFWEGILALGGEDEAKARRFFYLCKPGLRWSFMRTSAAQLANAQALRSSDGSSSERTSRTDSKPTEKPQKQRRRQNRSG